MSTTSSPSHASTEPSLGTTVRQAANDSGWPNTPKLVASSSEIDDQSVSVAERISTEVDVSDASTGFDGAIWRPPSASEFRAQPIRLRGTEGALVMATDLTLYL